MTEPFLPLAVPSFDETEFREIREALESGWITTGPKVRQLEKEIAGLVGARHAVAVSSCTAAMHLALEAAGIRRGDEVIVPTLTFASTANVVVHLGARPILADCLPDTLTLDPAAVERALESPHVRAMIPVHYAGHPCEMDTLLELAGARGLAVIEDAAHALPARYRGRFIGASPVDGAPAPYGERPPSPAHESAAVCFSFYATKNLTTGEGGMICTGREDLAERARIMCLHGISKDAWKRYSAEGSWYYEIQAPGYKYNLPDLLAAVGLAQIRKLSAFQERRRSIVARYTAAFGGLDALECPVAHAHVEHAWHLYVLRLRLDRLTISRDQFIQELRARGIGTSVHFIPLHLHPYYRETYGYRPEDFPVAYDAYRRMISLPLHPRMTDADVDRVVRAVTEVVAGARVVAI